MNPYYTTGTDAYRTLEADDIAGICAAYPPGRQTSGGSCTPRHGFSDTCGTVPPPKSGGCSVAPGTRGAGAAASALLAALAIVSARRRRGQGRRFEIS